ncbi:TPA: NAD(P)H-dependent oxidoreductase [Pseudomonas aeruginosa]
MNVLIVYAHPEPRSLNGALKDFAVARLEAAGHAVQVSDLYAMGWKAVLDAGDSLEREASERFDPSATSLRAFENGWQSVDIAGEQDKLRWADTLILQFPLWWFSMPAILKGWIDRVYACGFAYGVGEHSDSHWGDRYGEGRMQGKRAMLVVTAGGWESHYAARGINHSDSHWGDRYGEGRMQGKRAMLVVTAGGWESHYAARGINGPMDDLLFPIHHGILHYPGFEVLPPFVVYRSGRIDAERFAALSEQLGRRLDDLQRAAPIPFRRQNGGDYLIPALTLRDELAPQRAGFAMHLAE